MAVLYCMSVGRPLHLHTVLEMGRSGICQYTIPELLFLPKFHTGTYQQYILYLFIFFHFPCFAFKKYTGTSKCPFRSLAVQFNGHTNIYS
jgi:hypothetical protein